MPEWSVALILVATVTLLAGVVSYNRFARQRAAVQNSWANVDTELQRRHDLIPNLVETVRGYAAHERTTFEAVIAARSRATSAAPDGRADAEQSITAGLRQLLALAEAYPTLQADESFLALQRELVRTENRIQAVRRLHNGNVRELNRRVESVPSNLVAGVFGFGREPYFEVDPAVGAVPSASLG